MTEAEWLASDDPAKMLVWLTGSGRSVWLDRCKPHPACSDRKLRLLACAFCRREMMGWLDPPACAVVEVAERYADGEATTEELWAAKAAAKKRNPVGRTKNSAAVEWVTARLQVPAAVSRGLPWERSPAPENAAQPAAAKVEAVHLIRDLFGPLPFHSVTIPPTWLTWNDGTVPKMARHIYDTRDVSLLPILCDALEEAGCGKTRIIKHCRLPGDHVRGCWVLDLLLGKE